jgi:20S proteasome subunit beta 1
MDLGPCVPTEATGKSQAPHTGTTIVAVSFDGGVVLGADGRVSTGTYISNRASNKIQQLTDNVFLLRSGSAADTQAIGDYGAARPRTHTQQLAWLAVVVVVLLLLLLLLSQQHRVSACTHAKHAGPLSADWRTAWQGPQLISLPPSRPLLASSLLCGAAGLRAGGSAVSGNRRETGVHGAVLVGTGD